MFGDQNFAISIDRRVFLIGPMKILYRIIFIILCDFHQIFVFLSILHYSFIRSRAQLPTKSAYWVNLALASPFSALSTYLYMGGPVVIFYATNVFWTNSTKMLHFSAVPESNLEILITYVLSPGVLWHV